MGYLAEKPPLARPIAELRQNIPGWGVDLDSGRRPAVPKENYTQSTGAHWTVPERQVERYPREKSPEHRALTPVFGTACPPKGLSGLIRRYAYTFSEGRLVHWLLLTAGDRVDVLESRLQALAAGHPDNLLEESGFLSELKRHGIRARLGQHRADAKHQSLDAVLLSATGLWEGAVAAIRRVVPSPSSASAHGKN